MNFKAVKKSVIVAASIFGILSSVLIAGTAVAYNYESLLDVFFTKTKYTARDEVKQLCEDVAAEGLVLLKNEDNALPLKEDEKKVALLGQNSVDFVYGGSGSGAVDTSQAANLKEAFEQAGFNVNETLWNFYDTGAGSSYRKKTPDLSGRGDFQVNEVPSSKYTDDIKNSLKDDVGIVVLGRSGGESADLPLSPLPNGSMYLQIDKDEQDLLDLACSKFDKVILIMNTNNPVELGFLEDSKYQNVKAAMWIGGVGQEGIKAIPKILNGTVNPSGRLVDTYAYDSTSAPSFANMGDAKFTNSSVRNGQEYMVFAEGIYVGYRYYETRYEDVVLGNTTNFDYSSEVQFPFGYGLSYTSFEWSSFSVSENSDGKSYDLSLDVKNTGDVAGKDVVEFYLQKPYTPGGVEVSSIELVDFAKTSLLAPGEEETVSVNVLKKDMTSYDSITEKTYVLNKGDFYFSAGKNSHDALNNILSLKGKNVSDGMTYAGNPSLAKKALSNPSVDATTYGVSSVTGKEITNALDDVDLNYYDKDFKYLSRSDWEGTFPTKYKGGSWDASQEVLEDLEFFDVSSDTTDDELVNDFTYVTNSTETNLKVQDLIGADYDDPRWDDLISQLSFNQMTKLIKMGGYATIQLDKIGLPATTDKDGPSGVSGTLVGGGSAMAWPSEIVMASTWNTEMIERLGELFGEDSILVGVAGVYGPGANIHRSPYSGRNFEYYSEDPILSYNICEAETRGLRSKGVITYVKHFALNDQETNRYGSAIFANEQSCREIFMKGFEGSVAGGSNALMAAMNRVGTRWVGAHKGMMTQILRDEWGFEGMVITDQASSSAMKYQDMDSGLWAGTDLWLNTNESLWSLDHCKDDDTMLYYIHRAAKNIAFAVTNSWAVDESYKVQDDGTPIGAEVSIFPWRPLLWSVNGIVWATTVSLVAYILVVSLKKKKDN